jgi:hypothetical protein
VLQAVRPRDNLRADHCFEAGSESSVSRRIGSTSSSAWNVCLLVMIGVRADGTKEPAALADGYGGISMSRPELRRDCKRLGMTASVLAVGAVHSGSGRRSATCSRDP